MTAMQPESNRPALVVLNSPFIGRRYRLLGPVTLIGRNRECPVQLDLVSVSRQHACVEEQGGVFYVRDLGSRNGIRLGEQTVTRAPLKNGDIITVGEVDMRFEATAPAEPVQSPPTDAPAHTRDLTGQDILRRAQAEAPVGAMPTDPTRQSEEAAARRANTKLIVAVALGLGLAVLVGIWVVTRGNSSQGSRAIQLPPLLVSVDENRLVRIAGGFAEGNVTVDDYSVVAPRKYDENLLLLTGKAGGGANVSVVANNGRRYGIRVVVRGRVADPLDDLAFSRLTTEERRQQAEECFGRGVLIETEQPYRALQEYEKALALLKPLPDKGRLYTRARRRAESVGEEVETRWQELARDIRAAASNKNLTRVEELVAEAKMLVPDANDPRHQMAESTRLAILKKVLDEKKMRGRP